MPSDRPSPITALLAEGSAITSVIIGAIIARALLLIPLRKTRPKAYLI
jgi:uncharacterized MnhB-related membrane protein